MISAGPLMLIVRNDAPWHSIKAAVADGRVRVLAHWGGKRIGLFPEVPTLKESGYDAEYYLWVGLFQDGARKPTMASRPP